MASASANPTYQTLYSYNAEDPWYKKFGLKFLQSIDLGENLHRTSEAVASFNNGWTSLLIAPLSFLAFVAFASAAYHFDINSSWDAMEPFREQVAKSLVNLTAIGAFLAFLSQAVPFSFTVLPTILESLGSRFSRFAIPAIQVSVWFFVIFDAGTDIPRVNEFMGAYRDSFYLQSCTPELLAAQAHCASVWDWISLGQVVGFVAYGVAWTLMLLSASYFFELLAVLFLWATFAFLWKSAGYWVIMFLAGRKAAQRVANTIDEEAYAGGGARRSR